MSNNKWTDEQLFAINTRGNNLLVAAAAGSGKTAVLVERIVGHITDPSRNVDIDRLLVVTFTNAAAAEMRQRIGVAIAKKINEQPLSRHLHRQLGLLNKSYITTLHSFCLDIIKQHFHRVNIDPSFRIADDTEIVLLQSEVMEELLEQKYENLSEDSHFIDLVDRYGGERNDDRLQSLILQLHNFSRSQPWPHHWLRQIVQGFEVTDATKLEDFTWCKLVLNGVNLKLHGILENAKKALEYSMSPGGPEVYQPIIKEEIVMLEGLINASQESWDKLYRTFQTMDFSKLKPCRAEVDETLKERVKNLRDGVKKEANKIRDDYFSRSPEEYMDDMKKIAPFMDNLIALVIEYDELFKKVKLEKSLLDFSDLEHYCLEILREPGSTPDKLSPSPIALELQRQFVEVLVDEYQDINTVQEAILDLVSSPARELSATEKILEGGEVQGNNRFMVGDVKQSIYRFRLAEPNLFLNKYHDFSHERDSKNCRIDLAKNFRSRKEVIDGVNFVFKQIMTTSVGEMEYDQKAELVLGASYPEHDGLEVSGGTVELNLIDRSVQGSDFDDEENSEEQNQSSEDMEEVTTGQLEARLIAQRIHQLVEGDSQTMVLDKSGGEYRPATYSDIVVLLRATRNWANAFMEEFRELGIPSYADVGTGYFQAIEVETMLSLLKVIDNPRQDIHLAGVLRSAMFGFTVEELATIRMASTTGDFYDALKGVGETEETLAMKVTAFLQQLEIWRTRARQERLADLIWSIYEETGYYDYVGAMPGGSQRQANLRALYDRARQYEATSYRGLFRFLRFIEKLQSGGNDLGTARSLGENENVVRIMSTHKSKGLEFPIVFVAGLGKRFNMQDLIQDLLIHKDLGIGPTLVDKETMVKYPTLQKLAIKYKVRMESLAEEMRILYVALTRAREKLIMVGSSKKLVKDLKNWSSNISCSEWNLPQADVAKAKSCLDWIVPALVRHRDGEVLRDELEESTEIANEITQHESKWSINIYNNYQINKYTDATQTLDDKELLNKVVNMEPVAGYGDYGEIISQRLTWEYPYTFVTNKGAKVSVTEVKRYFGIGEKEEQGEVYNNQLFGLKRPEFLKTSKGLSPAERGTAMHLVMQHLDLKNSAYEESIKQQLEAMELAQVITPQQAEVIDIPSILAFFNSSLGKSVMSSNSVKREVPFTLALPAGEIYPELSEMENKESILVQGVIDLVIDEPDGLIIVDYKTDHVLKEDYEQLIKKYIGQINLYTRAIETIWKRPVKDKYLYLFKTGSAIKVS